MAQKVVVQVLDDITGEEGASTVRFGLDGVQYEIDLVSDEALRSALEPYVKAARRVGGSAPRPRSSSGASRAANRPEGKADPAVVRAWAKQNGYDVNERGRISVEVYDAYAQAN